MSSFDEFKRDFRRTSEPTRRDVHYKQIAKFMYQGIANYFAPDKVPTASAFLEAINVITQECNEMAGGVIAGQFELPTDEGDRGSFSMFFIITAIVEKSFIRMLRKNPTMLTDMSGLELCTELLDHIKKYLDEPVNMEILNRRKDSAKKSWNERFGRKDADPSDGAAIFKQRFTKPK